MTTPIRPQASQLCSHRWEPPTGAWGTIIGVTKCLDCGAVCRESDFHRHPTADPPARLPEARVCGVPAPDRSGRACDKPKGHDGDHWTYGGDTKTWARLPEEQE